MNPRRSHNLGLRRSLKFLVLIALSFSFSSCAFDPPIYTANINTEIPAAENAININTASAAELEAIPYIGEKLAKKIIEHRETHGKFRKAEHLMLVAGISDKRFREIRKLIKAE